MLGKKRNAWRRVAALAFAAVTILTGGAQAQDHSGLYGRAELETDAQRLATAARKIYELGIAPHLTAQEKQAIGDLQLAFPMPEPGDFALDFYAYNEDDAPVAVLPLLSLKTLEDVTTAYAWLHENGHTPGGIDLYFTMLRREDPSGLPGGRFPALLPALGIADDAWKEPGVDDLSLRLRNEAFAFVLLHELGHLVLDHEDYFEITTEQARADEVAADRFALEVLGRTGTPALGAVLLFQAQAYSLPHRGQFETDKAWMDFLHERGTHPLTTDRLRAMSDYSMETMPRIRPQEAQIWGFIGLQLSEVATILDDRELQDCIVKAGEALTLEDLKKRDGPAEALFARVCL